MHNQFAIIGGGIGGLTLATALQRRGYDVNVYEQAPIIKPLGAGIALAGNAMRALVDIGISDEVLQVSKVLQLATIKDNKGNVITQTDVAKVSSKLGVINSFTLHRADLHQVLLDQLLPNTLQINKSCVDFEQRPSEVTLQFSDGTTARANYLIAADGIHSNIRKKLLPNSTSRYAGYTCWRGVIDTIPREVDINELSESWGPGSRFGIVPLTDNRIYWFACLNAKANDEAMRTAKVAQLLTFFKDFHPAVLAVLRNSKDEHVIWNDIIDIKPIRQFAFGNVVLLGDAAHATTPNLGQGACMAIEDAAVLANCVSSYVTVEEAFRRYEQRRIARTTKIVNDSWRFGKLAQWKNPLLVTLRNTLVRLTPPKVAEKQLRFLTDVSFV